MATNNSKEEATYVFTKAELADFKRFWNSEVGQKYMKKMEDTKQQLLDAAMGSLDTDYILRSTAIANGFQSVIVDIKSIINAVDTNEKKEAKAKTE